MFKGDARAPPKRGKWESRWSVSGLSRVYYPGARLGLKARFEPECEHVQTGEVALSMATIDPIRTGKAYTVTQAARLAKTSPQNIRNWLVGRGSPGYEIAPVLGPKSRDTGSRLAVSFLELAELVVVAKYRNGQGKRIPLKRLRAAQAFARDRLRIEYPFASGRFKLLGANIIHEYEEANPGPGIIAVDTGGNYMLPIEMDQALELFDFDSSGSEHARRWYPAGKSVPIVVDPECGAGWPVIAGRNVRTSVLIQRWQAGWRYDELAEDFDMPTEVVEAAVRAGVSLAA